MRFPDYGGTAEDLAIIVAHHFVGMCMFGSHPCINMDIIRMLHLSNRDMLSIWCSVTYVFSGWSIIIIIIMVDNMAGYLVEERRRWPVITAFPRGQCSK